MVSKLFETTTINTMTLANRFVRSATAFEMATENGQVTPELIGVMVKLAEGGVGLIITGHSYVSRVGRVSPQQLGIYSDKLLPDLTKMAEAVHKASGKIVVQLAHAGVVAASQLTGLEPLGPSAIEGDKGPICKEMTQEEIRGTVKAFRQGATRAKQAGFDGVEIHAAHGWLLNQFLSPLYNKRIDAYGGSIENRARMVLETYQSIRDAVGTQFPVIIKLNSEDLLDGGFTVEDMLQVAVMLEDIGIDAIDMSGGTVFALVQGNPDASFSRTGKKEVYWREAAQRYKETISVPLMLVGGIRSYEVVEELVEEGVTDYICLSRPLIREPDLINRWMSGDTKKADCISDNLCMMSGAEGKGAHCVHVSDK